MKTTIAAVALLCGGLLVSTAYSHGDRSPIRTVFDHDFAGSMASIRRLTFGIS
ncbi:hypothetical protein AB6Q20_005138 [Salmonella enterica]|nr:hypothetical protein [Salmonella enterica]